MLLLEARGVTRHFGAVRAVDDVDMAVAAGEVVGLLGANGAGKTTCMRMVLGLLRPSAGSVRLFGLAPSRATRARIGYVPQGLGLFDDLTVNENLAFAAAAYGRARRAEPTLAAVGDRLVRDLPLGIRRRVAFAAALGHDPDLLVLDEPTSGVDPLGRARLWDATRAAADAGAGVLVSTHYLREAEQCDRLLVMSAGRVVAAGRVPEVVGEQTAVLVETDAWAAALTALENLAPTLVGRGLRVAGGDAPAVRAALAAAGVPGTVTVVPATLEEAFVRHAAASA